MKNLYIGFDIGGTKIDAGLVQGNKILKRKTVPTSKNKKDFLATIFAIIEDFAVGKIKGIGLGMAGAIDGKSGKIVRSPNLPELNGLNLKKAIKKKFGIPARIDNDAKCFMRAEMKFGAAKNRRNAVGLILGTGIGAGIMIDGKIYYGRNGTAGEIGHTIINAELRIKNAELRFKNLQSFEDLVSKKGFLKLGVKDIEKLAGRARQGDKKALKIFEVIGDYLGIGLANIINILNPEIIILGGGLANVSRYLIKSAKRMVKKLVLSPEAGKIPIVVSKIGDKTGILGAVSQFIE